MGGDNSRAKQTVVRHFARGFDHGLLNIDETFVPAEHPGALCEPLKGHDPLAIPNGYTRYRQTPALRSQLGPKPRPNDMLKSPELVQSQDATVVHLSEHVAIKRRTAVFGFQSIPKPDLWLTTGMGEVQDEACKWIHAVRVQQTGPGVKRDPA